MSLNVKSQCIWCTNRSTQPYKPFPSSDCPAPRSPMPAAPWWYWLSWGRVGEGSLLHTLLSACLAYETHDTEEAFGR